MTLYDFLATQGWTVPWTRLVLFGVYVRTHLTFGAATWCPAYLHPGAIAQGHTPLCQLAVEHRRALRTLTQSPADIRSSILFIATLQWPLEVALAKVTYRYYHRVRQMQESNRDRSTPVAVVARWAGIQQSGAYTV